MAQDNTSTNLEKACDLLLTLAQEDTAVPVAEISQRLNISRTTAYSMLASLQSRGFVEKNAEGRYTAGFALLRLADGYQQLYPFLPTAEMHMHTLAERWEQSFMLAVYKSPCYLVMLRMVSGQRHMEAVNVSGVMNALLTAGGKLLMSVLPEEILTADLNQGPSTLLLPHHPYEPDQLAQEIRTLRGCRYVIERNAYSPGRGSIAAPVYNRQGRVIAALSSSLDLTRLDKETEDRLIADLTSTSLRISSDCGFPLPPLY